MAENLARFQDDRQIQDYRHMKQPLHLKNANELEIMTVAEKEMYLEKLRNEIKEHKFREATYEAKKKELLEIETAFRQVQRGKVKKIDISYDKIQNKQMVANNLKDQVKEFQRKIKLQDGAQRDIQEKISNISDALKSRSEEAQELQNVIRNKGQLGNQKQNATLQLKNEQEQLIKQFETQKEALFNIKEEKEQNESAREQLHIKIRDLRSQLQISERRRAELNQKIVNGNKDLRELEDQIYRADSDLNKKNNQLSELQFVKNEIETNICQFTNLKNKMKQEKLIKNEENRRTQNSNITLQSDIERFRDIIDDTIHKNEQIMRQNNINKGDINQILREVEGAKKKIFYLEDQNINLELELDKFLASDNEIREKLQNRRRSPLKVKDLYIGNPIILQPLDVRKSFENHSQMQSFHRNPIQSYDHQRSQQIIDRSRQASQEIKQSFQRNEKEFNQQKFNLNQYKPLREFSKENKYEQNNIHFSNDKDIMNQKINEKYLKFEKQESQQSLQSQNEQKQTDFNKQSQNTNKKYPQFSKQIFQRDSFRDIQPLPQNSNKITNINEKNKESGNIRIKDEDYSLNNYFSSKYAQNYKQQAQIYPPNYIMKNNNSNEDKNQSIKKNSPLRIKRGQQILQPTSFNSSSNYKSPYFVNQTNQIFE